MNGTRLFRAAVLAAWALGVAAPAMAAKQATLGVDMGSASLMAGQKQTAYLKVSLTGFPMEDPTGHSPVNLAIVLDKSGSMGGDKIAKARDAAIMALDRLRGDDIVSVIVYDSTVRVVVPATKLTDREAVYGRIRNIEAGGSTALFGGVSKGAGEVRKFLSRERINHIVLLSDGLANVGPSSATELGELGASLGKDGITVSTIGLGLDYNSELMAKLALTSDGNHYFAEKSSDLAQAFDKEFGRALSVVAQKIEVEIECAPGFRPVRVLGREADIAGQKVVVTMNHLYSEQEKRILVELESPAAEAGQVRRAANVSVRYENMATEDTDQLEGASDVHFIASKAAVDQSVNAKVMADVVELIGVERSRLATKLREEGKIEEAKRAFASNQAYLGSNVMLAPKIQMQMEQQRSNVLNIDKDGVWDAVRNSTQADDAYRVKQ